MWQFNKPSSTCTLLAIFVIAVGIAGCNVQPTPPPIDISAVDLDDDFVNQIQSVPTVLVKFGATWCGPCVRLDKELEGLSATLGSDAKIIVIDVEENRNLATTFQVGAIPHMVLFKGGKAVDQKVGYHSADEVADWMGITTSGAASTAIQTNPFVSAQ
jgi:thioredoxin 1